MQNTLMLLDTLIAGLTLKNAVEEADLKVMAVLKKAIAEGRDVSDAEVTVAREHFLAAARQWNSNKSE